MSSTLRTRVAAAVLLSPLAALLAEPALADHRDVAVQPAIVANGGYAQEGWRPGWRRDQRPPRITDLTPQPGEFADGRRRTLVSARFSDNFSGVDVSSVRLRIDGRDVTHEARIAGDEVRLRDQLRPGRHVAEVMVRDRAGNLARRSWQFDVPGRHERYGYGYGDDRRWGRD